MEWFLLIYNMFFTGYSFYAWKKYSDKESLWLGIIGIFVVFLLASKVFFLNSFSESVRGFLNEFVYYSWFLVFGSLIFTLLKPKITKYILYGVLIVFLFVVIYLQVVGINGTHLRP
jgi:hypothetical protein